MQKKSLTKFQYIDLLVAQIKLLHSKKENFDWYFNEFITLYTPLIYKTSKDLREQSKKINFFEAKARVLEFLFDAILRYSDTFTNDNNTNKKFKKVYFSQYLKSKLYWDKHRLLKPQKDDYDDTGISGKYVELDLKNTSIKEKFMYSPKFELPDNFVTLCRWAQKKLKDDNVADIMILQYHYGFKPLEISRMLKIPKKRFKPLLNKLKAFWLEHSEKLS